jgi:adhesin/invasin
VTSNGVPSPAVNFEVAATGPGVFTPLESTHVLALNLADGKLNGSESPARPGQYVVAYLTGQGLVDPPVATGDVAPASPFSMPVALVQIKIGGFPCDIPFAGMAPGFVGLMQMNVLIPDVPPGEQSFDVSVGGVAAATTTISIGPKQ